MGNLLYDLRVAEEEINNNSLIFSTDSVRRDNLFNSVLKKHKVTRKQLETSIDWYAGDLERYHKIMNNLSERFTENIQYLKDSKIQLDALANQTGLPLVNDSMFFFNASNISPNLFSFCTDTSFYSFGGIYEVQFNLLGIDANINPELTFCVKCADTTFVRKTRIENNGPFSESIDITIGKRFREAYGYIRFPEISSRDNIFIYDFRILKRTDQLRLAEPLQRELN